EARFVSAAASRGVGNMRAVSEPVSSRRISELKSRFGDSTVLVFKTLTWFVSHGQDERRYQTLYRAEAHLIRLRDGAGVWRGERPMQNPGYANQSTLPTFHELTRNNGELLRARLTEAATACADHLVRLCFGDQ